MIEAGRAQRIMQMYENDYDNFLKKLRKKHADKKKEAADKKDDADTAEKNLKEAEGHKGHHLKEKVQGLIDKAGGIEGAKSTINNVMHYFKDKTPSDYEVSMGGSNDDSQNNSMDDKKDTTGDDKKNFAQKHPVLVIGGSALLLIGLLWGASKAIKIRNAAVKQHFKGTATPAV